MVMKGGSNLIMRRYDLVKELIDMLQLILDNNIYDLDSNIKADIKADAEEAFCKILDNYGILKD